jgi:hypothetical protein
VQLFVATDEARESQKPSETPKPGSPNSGNLLREPSRVQLSRRLSQRQPHLNQTSQNLSNPLIMFDTRNKRGELDQSSTTTPSISGKCRRSRVAIGPFRRGERMRLVVLSNHTMRLPAVDWERHKTNPCTLCRGSDKQVQIRNAPAEPLLIGFHQTKCGSHSFIDRDRQELPRRVA